MSDQSNNSRLPGILGLGITVAVGIASVAAYMMSRNRTEEPQRHNQPPRPTHTAQQAKPDGRRITLVVETSAQCGKVVDLIRQDCAAYRVLGFDCKKTSSGNVVLLQLATHNGTCVLIRLNKLPHLPDELSKILADPQIIKVGIDARNDARRLASVGISVVGTLDLRFVADQMGVRPGGLHEMTEDVLNYRLAPAPTPCNWIASELDDRLRDSAAEDALACVEIIKKLEERHIGEGGLFDERNIDTFLQQFHTYIL